MFYLLAADASFQGLTDKSKGTEANGLVRVERRGGAAIITYANPPFGTMKGAEGLDYAKRLTRAAFDRPVAAGLADERRSFLQLIKLASAREGLTKGRPPAEIQKV